MSFQVGLPLLFADTSAASSAMRSYITPVIATLCTIASLACAFFLVNGGIQYMTSSGKPEKLEQAKKIIKNALIGLALVIGAATLTAVLAHAYNASGGTMADKFPTLAPIQQTGGTSFFDIVMKAIVGVLRNIVQSVGEPFVQALGYFTNGTPLMGDNSNVFNMWLAIIGITDVLFILVVALLGFHVMSFATFGFDELELKHLLPQLALIFLLINTSIFAIDAIISLSNGMIYALRAGFPCTSIWDLLADITKQSSQLGLAGLLVMIAFLVLTVMLLVYYVGRLIVLYLGAILSPLVLLLWLIPSFKDFAMTALKVYLVTIFVLFVQVVILQLASSIFTGMLQGDTIGQPNILMAMMVGLATVVALLKTQGVMRELSYAASAPRAAREMAGSFMRGVSYMNKTAAAPVKAVQTGTKATNRVKHWREEKIKKGTDSGTQTTEKGKKSQSSHNPVSSTPLKTGETRKADKTEKKQ